MKTGTSIGVGVNAWVWDSPFNVDSVSLIERAAGMGFDAFTIPVEDPELIDVKAILAAQREHPLRFYVSGAYGIGPRWRRRCGISTTAATVLSRALPRPVRR